VNTASDMGLPVTSQNQSRFVGREYLRLSELSAPGCLLQKGAFGAARQCCAWPDPDASQTDLMLQLESQRRGGILRWCLTASMAA